MTINSKGSYTIILRCHQAGKIRVGRLGEMQLQTGFYVYSGSAFGPGGINARLRHHYKKSLKPHWHLDYLRAACEPVEHWFTHDEHPREHDWAAVLLDLPAAYIALPGFGSSDCNCLTHLAFLPERPSFELFLESLTERCPDHDAVFQANENAIQYNSRPVNFDNAL